MAATTATATTNVPAGSVDLGSYDGSDVYGVPTTGTAGSTTWTLPQFGGINVGESSQGWDANYYGTTPSQNQATPWESSFDAALQAAGAPGGAGSGSGTTLEQAMFGSPSGIAGAAPQPFSSFGNVPVINPSYMTPAQVNPADASTFMQQYESAAAAGLAPQFANQTQDLNDSMASRGIFNSTAAQDQQTRLAGQQDAALASAEAPIISQGFSAAQQDAVTNAQLSQDANKTNVGAANTAAATNAGTQLGVAQSDQAAYNAFEQELLGLGSQTGTNELDALLGSYSPNGGATSILGQGAASAGSAYNNTYGAVASNRALGSAIAGAFSKPTTTYVNAPNYDGPNPTSAFGYNYNPFTNYTLPGQ